MQLCMVCFSYIYVSGLAGGRMCSILRSGSGSVCMCMCVCVCVCVCVYIYIYIYITHLRQQCHNSKFVIFQEKRLKVLKCCNFQ